MVNSWERKLSKSKFLLDTYNLNIEISRLIRLAPKKFKGSYSDQIIKQGLDAFATFEEANSFYISDTSSDTEIKNRKAILKRGKAQLDTVMITLAIFLDYMTSDNNINIEKAKEIEEEFSNTIISIENMVDGLINYGDRIIKERKSKKKNTNTEEKKSEVKSEEVTVGEIE